MVYIGVVLIEVQVLKVYIADFQTTRMITIRNNGRNN